MLSGSSLPALLSVAASEGGESPRGLPSRAVSPTATCGAPHQSASPADMNGCGAPASSDVKICAFPGCGKPLVKGALSRAQWEKRKYCNEACRQAHIAANARRCLACNEVLVRDKSRESQKTFERRHYCRDAACQMAARAMRENAKRICPVCEATYTHTGRTCGAMKCRRSRCADGGRAGARVTASRHGAPTQRLQRAREDEKIGLPPAEFTRPAIVTDSIEEWLAAAGGVDAVRARAPHYTVKNDALGPTPVRPRTGKDGRV